MKTDFRYPDAEIDTTATGEDTFRSALKGDDDAAAIIIGKQASYKF